MKNILILLVLISSISCMSKNKEVEKQKVDNHPGSGIKSDIAIEKNEEIPKLDSLELNTEEIESDEEIDDCIFDQSTQTDEFLKGIQELKNYKWDSDLKTATVILENKDTLFIKRGGCNHFGVSAEFRIVNDTADYSKWSNVFEKVIWIANVLDNEFANDSIIKEIEENKIEIIKSEDYDIGYFSGEYLNDNNYSIERKMNDQIKVIILSYYIN
jgi:hypothetical protein